MSLAKKTPVPELTMARIIEFADEGIGHTSHLVDLGDGTGLVIDPRRIPELERAEADARGLRIAYTADTHSHADFVSGSPELAASGATFLAPASGHLDVPHYGMRDEERVKAGPFVLKTLATPGHTPDHLAYLLERDDGTPVALFSGGSLMVGTVGRTDLLGSEQAEELARAQFHSLHERILTLPEDLPVYPTHGAGSFCSAPGGAERSTTIGSERAHNPLLQFHDESNFVDALLAGFGSFPAFFRRLPEVNRRGPRIYGTMPPLPSVDLEAFRAAVENGAQIVDARPIVQYATAHIPGSLSIELRPVFATWLGWLVNPSRPVVFILDDSQDRHELVRQCLTVGVELLVGELVAGYQTWAHLNLPGAATELIEPGALDAATVLDVRQHDEFLGGHLPDAHNIELGALRNATDLLPTHPLVVMCGHGERAMTGASVLEQAGRGDLEVLVGGPEDWAAACGRILATGP